MSAPSEISVRVQEDRAWVEFLGSDEECEFVERVWVSLDESKKIESEWDDEYGAFSRYTRGIWVPVRQVPAYVEAVLQALAT